MRNIVEMIASTHFALFMLGLLGLAFFEKVFVFIKKCNPKVFSISCVILTYIVIMAFNS